MRATLHIISGPATGRSFLIRNGEVCRFGRTDWAADVAVPHDEQLADQHFSLDCTGGQCRVRDLGTTGGTYVNGERQLAVVVHDGDLILAGQTKFRLEIEGEPAAESEPVQIPLPLHLSTDNPLRPYQAGVTDEDADVRWEALQAAAWGRQARLLDYCREASAFPQAEHWEALVMLAVLGEPQDLDRVLAVGRTTELGPPRFELLGKFGHPGVVDELLIRIESPDAATAVAAGAAFVRITGFEIDTEPEAEGPAATGLEEEEAADLSTDDPPPDPRLARTLWNRESNRFLQGTRWSSGLELSQGATAEIQRRLDLQSYWETQLRDHFFGRRPAGPGLFSQFRP